MEFVSQDSVDDAKAFLVKKGFDFDFVVGDPERVCARMTRFGVDVTVPRGLLIDHAARAGAVTVFRYLATNTDKFSKATMSAAFAGGALEIIRLVEAKVSFASATAVEAAEWAAEALHHWNFEVAEWLLRERPDVVADAVAARILWMAAAKARDLATLRTLPLPRFMFGHACDGFLALLCGPKHSVRTDPGGIIVETLMSDDVEVLALLSWAISWTPHGRHAAIASGVRVRAFASGNVHIINAVFAMPDSMFDSRFGTMSLVMGAIAACHHDVTLALMCRGPTSTCSLRMGCPRCSSRAAMARGGWMLSSSSARTCRLERRICRRACARRAPCTGRASRGASRL
jgi:hypothetical protein